MMSMNAFFHLLAVPIIKEVLENKVISKKHYSGGDIMVKNGDPSEVAKMDGTHRKDG